MPVIALSLQVNEVVLFMKTGAGIGDISATIYA
jgi:hypothetical protein